VTPDVPDVETPSPPVCRFGVFQLDMQSGELRRHGLRVRLPDQSFQILKTLLGRPGEVVTRDELRQVLWTSETFVDFEVGLNSAVRKLREALDDSPENPRFIETLPRRGYRFVGSVAAPAGDSEPPLERAADRDHAVVSAVEQPRPSMVAPVPAHPPAFDVRRRSIVPRAALWGAVAASVLTASVLGATWASRWGRAAVADYRPVTYHRGIVSSARFTPDGQSFVYSASWEGRPYAAFLGRSVGGDARDLQLKDSRIVSISRAGDMALLFGPQNVARAFGTRTLSRIPLAGGARRDMLTGVVDADWVPGTDALAVIRDPGGGGPWTVEFPVGTTVHEARAAWSLRVAPDGTRVAFFEGPRVFDAAPEAMITVIEKSGRKSTVARELTGLGLAWTASGTEIWFTATRPGQHAPHLRAVSLSGVERTVHRTPDWLVLHDISADGRALVSRNTIRISMACGQPNETRERDLSWLLASLATGLSRDGQTIVFADPLGARAPSGQPTLFRRPLDGSPAVQIGEGDSGAISPDGRWILALSGGKLILLPSGAGATISLPKGDVVRVGPGRWLGDSKRIVFTGYSANGKPRGYIQETPTGSPRAVTPEGVTFGKAAVRADDSLLGRVGATWALFSMQDQVGRPVAALTPRDVPVQWSQDGRYVYTVDNVTEPSPPAVDVFRVELATGDRVLWKTLAPADPVGVEDLRTSVVITPDAQSYCYSYMRRLGDLFVVDGLK
jgi:DNA-binding winged helix-turn-helix (wHTH) protein